MTRKYPKLWEIRRFQTALESKAKTPQTVAVQGVSAGVAEDVGRHMSVGQLPLHQLPHTLVGRLGERLAVLHGQHKPGVAALLVLRQPRLQLIGEGDIPPPRVSLQRVVAFSRLRRKMDWWRNPP